MRRESAPTGLATSTRSATALLRRLACVMRTADAVPDSACEYGSTQITLLPATTSSPAFPNPLAMVVVAPPVVEMLSTSVPREK
jgi:hypothetical protein